MAQRVGPSAIPGKGAHHRETRMPHPLVTIHFYGRELESVRHWYHVPRAGDMVVLTTDLIDSASGKSVADGVIDGRARTVNWLSNGDVEVLVEG